MEIQAVIWYWTIRGMRRRPDVDSTVQYVEKAEAEKLLEEAHQRGYEQGRAVP